MPGQGQQGQHIGSDTTEWMYLARYDKTDALGWVQQGGHAWPSTMRGTRRFGYKSQTHLVTDNNKDA